MEQSVRTAELKVQQRQEEMKAAETAERDAEAAMQAGKTQMEVGLENTGLTKFSYPENPEATVRPTTKRKSDYIPEPKKRRVRARLQSSRASDDAAEIDEAEQDALEDLPSSSSAYSPPRSKLSTPSQMTILDTDADFMPPPIPRKP